MSLRSSLGALLPNSCHGPKFVNTCGVTVLTEPELTETESSSGRLHPYSVKPRQMSAHKEEVWQ